MANAPPSDADSPDPVQPEILPDGFQLGTQIKFDERAASVLFTKWTDRLQRKGIDPVTSRICLRLAEEILSDRDRLKMLGLPDSGTQIPQSVLDAIDAKNAPESK